MEKAKCTVLGEVATSASSTYESTGWNACALALSVAV